MSNIFLEDDTEQSNASSILDKIIAKVLKEGKRIKKNQNKVKPKPYMGNDPMELAG